MRKFLTILAVTCLSTSLIGELASAATIKHIIHAAPGDVSQPYDNQTYFEAGFVEYDDSTIFFTNEVLDFPAWKAAKVTDLSFINPETGTDFEFDLDPNPIFPEQLYSDVFVRLDETTDEVLNIFTVDFGCELHATLRAIEGVDCFGGIGTFDNEEDLVLYRLDNQVNQPQQDIYSWNIRGDQGGGGFLQYTSALTELEILATADNSYGIYLGTDTSVNTLIGGDNNLTAGAIFNPERYSIQVEDTDYIYVAAWSDRRVAQGLLVDIFNQTTGDLLTSGDLNWEVTATGISLNHRDSAPTLLQLTQQIGLANNQTNPSNGWQEISIGHLNDFPDPGSGSLSHFISKGFSSESQLMWYDSGISSSSGSPFNPGADHDEYLIFRLSADSTSVPEPTMTLLGSMACLALGSVLKKKQSQS